MDQVFNTVELTELILSHLMMRDLFAAQRVNFLWHNIIKSSRRIQRTRYLLATSSPTKDGGRPEAAHANPLLLQRYYQQACFHALQQLNPSVRLMTMDRFVLERVESFADAEASWRDMLLFQPPVKLAVIRPMSAHIADDGCFMISNDGGLKMADVVDFFKQKALEGGKFVELLSKTAIRKVMWTSVPGRLTT